MCRFFDVLFFTVPAAHGIYAYGHTLSLLDALPIWDGFGARVSALQAWRDRRGMTARGEVDSAALAAIEQASKGWRRRLDVRGAASGVRSDEPTSELQSLMRISYAVFWLQKKTTTST